jgi:hypothetical protein
LTGQSTLPLTLRISAETAPPGGMVQMKAWTTEVTPIFGGRPALAFDPSTFSGFAGFAVGAPNGEAAGAAVIEGNHVQIFYSGTGTSMPADHYPILTVSLLVRPDAIPDSTTQFALDPQSTFSLSPQSTFGLSPQSTFGLSPQSTFSLSPQSTFGLSSIGSAAATISPATVTVGGTTSITDVIPGEGVWPAGTVVSVHGTGFDEKTSLKVNGASVKEFTFVSPTELQFQLLETTDIRGLRIVVKGDKNSATYYPYMRGIGSIVSGRTLLAAAEPIFSVNARDVATFGPSGPLGENQYMALALQNPNTADVWVEVSLYAADDTLLHEAGRTLESRHRLALEMSELLDGITPAADMRVVVTASAPIDAFSLLCDEGTWSASPILPLESIP